jgi:hypothetical protein
VTTKKLMVMVMLLLLWKRRMPPPKREEGGKQEEVRLARRPSRAAQNHSAGGGLAPVEAVFYAHGARGSGGGLWIRNQSEYCQDLDYNKGGAGRTPLDVGTCGGSAWFTGGPTEVV